MVGNAMVGNAMLRMVLLPSTLLNEAFGARGNGGATERLAVERADDNTQEAKTL